MGEATLKVPAEYADDFRMAVIGEMAWDIEMIQDDAKEAAQKAWHRRHGVREDAHVSIDLPNHRKQLLHDATVLEQAGIPGVHEGLEIHVKDPSDLAHICERMAEKVVGPRLQEALNIGPMEMAPARTVRKLAERITWAVDQAAELHARLRGAHGRARVGGGGVMAASDLRRFIRAAELYGVSGIFEEAARRLGPHDQGRLALHLRRVLTRAQAMELAVGLVGQDTPDKKVRELAGIFSTHRP